MGLLKVRLTMRQTKVKDPFLWKLVARTGKSEKKIFFEQTKC